MSIVIALSREDFSVIATDSRIVPLNPMEKPVDYHSKLYSYDSLWLAGVGYGPLMTLLHSNLQSNQISEVDQIEPLFKMACDYIRQNIPLEEQISFNETGMVYSLVYQNEGLLHTQINLLDQKKGSRPLPINHVLIYPPTDSKGISGLIDSHLFTLAKIPSLDEVIYNIALLIKEVSNSNSWVSNICDLGLLIKEQDNLILKVNVRESADTIIQAHIDKTLRNYWKIIDTYDLRLPT